MPADSVKRLLPWLVAVAFFMEPLDTTILNTAVPAIADGFRIAALHFGGEHRPGPEGMVPGIHWTFLALGAMTIATSLVFARLRPTDGAAMAETLTQEEEE